MGNSLVPEERQSGIRKIEFQIVEHTLEVDIKIKDIDGYDGVQNRTRVTVLESIEVIPSSFKRMSLEHSEKRDLMSLEHSEKRDLMSLEHSEKQDLKSLEHSEKQDLKSLEHSEKRDSEEPKEFLPIFEKWLTKFLNLEVNGLHIQKTTSLVLPARGNVKEKVFVETIDYLDISFSAIRGREKFEWLFTNFSKLSNLAQAIKLTSDKPTEQLKSEILELNPQQNFGWFGIMYTRKYAIEERVKLHIKQEMSLTPHFSLRSGFVRASRSTRASLLASLETRPLNSSDSTESANES